MLRGNFFKTPCSVFGLMTFKVIEGFFTLQAAVHAFAGGGAKLA
jgi:hypothetical protein